MTLDAFVQAYVDCMLWCSLDDHDKPLDDNYGPEDIAPEALAEIIADCEAFQKDNWKLLAKVGTWEQHGHDFWLTRNRHGAGYWDRGYGEVGQELTDKAHVYGEVNPYVGQDGRIYL